MDVDGAARFVRRCGDDADRLRLDLVLGRRVKTAAAVRAVAAGQRPDGGWAPSWSAESGLDATCFRLARVDALLVPGRGSAPMRRGAAFLSQRQGAEGGWEEDAHYAEAAPPRCRPGAPAAMLYVTANCAYWLARLAPRSNASARAARFLAAAVLPDGRLPSFPHAQWLAAGALWQRERAVAEALLDALGARLADLEAGGLAWLVTALRGVGVPASRPPVAEALARAQAADGRFPSDDGAAGDVGATLEALRALGVGRPKPPA